MTFAPWIALATLPCGHPNPIKMYLDNVDPITAEYGGQCPTCRKQYWLLFNVEDERPKKEKKR